jgi:hypothetical protein
MTGDDISMSAHESEKNGQKYSESLFSDSDSLRAAAKIEQAVAFEKQKRQRIFLKYLLPFCLFLLLCVAYIMRKPVRVIFYGPPPFEMPAEQKDEPVIAETGEKNQKHFGNPDAAMTLYMRFMEEFHTPEEIIELAQSAVESKPSEIFLTIEFRQPTPGEQEYQILINGQSEVVIETEEGQRKIDLQQAFKSEDFILALENIHAQTYGQVSSPLKLSLSPEALEKRRLAQEAAPAVILPKKNASEVKLGERAILLPDFKADTTIISP